MSNKILQKKVSVIIPAFNEARTVCGVIKEVLKLREVFEVILVDDGSTDKTNEKIAIFKSNERFTYFTHRKNRGKGAALRTGVLKAKKDIILLLDADLMNITTAKIRKIINPVLKDEVDIARAGFKLARGRVTEMAVKPMMSILFPHLKFDQPISGQICAKKNFLEKISFENRWGVDIGILFDAIQIGARMVEVNIGKLEHKARKDNEKAEMAQQVLETMIKKAGLIQHKYKLVIFSLENILVSISQIKKMFNILGVGKEIEELRLKYESGDISFVDYTIESAKLLKGKDVRHIEEQALRLQFIKYTREVVAALQKRKYKVAIISSNFSPIVYPIARILGVDLIDCISLESHNSKLTGNIYTRSAGRWLEENAEVSFAKAFRSILRRAKTKPLQSIIVSNTEKCGSIFSKAGLSVSFRPKDKSIKEIANKTISILPELLAILE